VPDRHPPRKCQACAAVYIPTGSSQRWCITCCPSKAWAARTSRYGVTKPIWDAMLAAQHNSCVLCTSYPDAVDHCHETGKVRGLLCSPCNFRLGGLEDNSWRGKASRYRAFACWLPSTSEANLPMNTRSMKQSRACLTCGDKYYPTGNRQKWCAECCPGMLWRSRIQTYGVSKKLWDIILTTQGGTCALCPVYPRNVDHCHKTGRIRGLLCDSCNWRLVGFDNEIWHAKAEVYLASYNEAGGHHSQENSRAISLGKPAQISLGQAS
jgi:hypothetical protein